jgi:hypothetical protein
MSKGMPVTMFGYGREKNAVGYGEDVGRRLGTLDESGSKEVGRSHPNPLGNCSGSGEDRGRRSAKEANFLSFCAGL